MEVKIKSADDIRQFEGHLNHSIILQLVDKIIAVKDGSQSLFKDKFTSYPIPGIMGNHFTIESRYVLHVFNDARIGKYRCSFCQDASRYRECEICGRSCYELVPGSICDGTEINYITESKMKLKLTGVVNGDEW